jgi:NDP-4-keto-2,6-dideoxyhexose 3-C-methyltransferase
VNCRLCSSDQSQEVLDFGPTPYTGVFPLPDEKVPIEPLRVVRCEKCNLVQLDRDYPPHVLYQPATYGYESSLNGSMKRHLEETAKRLSDGLEHAVALDIGCNDGAFLRALPSTWTRLGVDPLAEKWAWGADIYAGLFPAVALPYDGELDLITTIAVFYASPKPRDFVKRVSELLRPGGRWFIEQAYLPDLLYKLAYDVFCQEHVTYFGLENLSCLGREFDLAVEDFGFNDVNGGSFWAILRKGGMLDPRLSQDFAAEHMQDNGLLAAQVKEHAAALRSIVTSFGGSILGYGASTKGNIVLHMTGIGPGLLPAIAEVNPSKFGRVTPCGRIPIISEQEARMQHPAAMLVLPWHFREGIIKRERRYLEDGGKLIFPLPETVEVYG